MFVLTIATIAFAQIDVLEAQVAELEGAVVQLDEYSRALESKYGVLELG